MTTETILRAASFAARAHHGQTRKGTADIPYVDHVLDVAARLAAVHPQDEILIVAGLLHDTVEDCDVTRADVAKAFGEEVAALVIEVTDPPGLSEDARRAAQERHVREASDRAKRLKMADKASNLTAIARTPPDWSAERMGRYIDWACRVIDPIRGIDARLESAFDAAVDNARSAAARRD